MQVVKRLEDHLGYILEELSIKNQLNVSEIN